MPILTPMQKAGLVVLILSLSLGLAGTIWSIYSSFSALENAENAGLGLVEDEIRNALLFTLGGLIGSVVGMLMVFFGRSKSGGY